MSSLRERIIEVASDLFQTRGINSTGVDTIVAEAGIAKMTLYKNFKGKEDLILEVLNRRQAEFTLWLKARLSSSKAAPSDRILQLFDLIDEWISAPDFRGMPFLKAVSEFPNEASAVHRLSVQHASQLRHYLTELCSAAEIRSPEALAIQLSLLIKGAMFAEQINPGRGAARHAKQAAAVLIESMHLH